MGVNIISGGRQLRPMGGWVLFALLVGTAYAGLHFPHLNTVDEQEILQRQYQVTDTLSLFHHALSSDEWLLVLISPQERSLFQDRPGSLFLLSQVEITNSAIKLLKEQLSSSSWPLSGLDRDAVGLLILQSGEEIRKLKNILLIPRGDSGTVILVYSPFAATGTISRALIPNHFAENHACRSAFLGESFSHYFQHCQSYYTEQYQLLPQYSLDAAREAIVLSSAVVLYLPAGNLPEVQQQAVSSVALWSSLQKEYPHHVVQWLQLEAGADWQVELADFISNEENFPPEDLIGFVYCFGAPIVPVLSSTSIHELYDQIVPTLRSSSVSYAGSFNIRELLEGSSLVYILVIEPSQQNHQDILRTFKQAEASRNSSERKKKQIRFLWTDNADLVTTITSGVVLKLPALLALRDEHVHELPLDTRPTESDLLSMMREYQQHALSVHVDSNHPYHGLMASPFASPEGQLMNHLVLLYQPVCGSCNLLRHGILTKLKQLISQVPQLDSALRIYEWDVKEIPFPPHLVEILSFYPLTEVPAILLFPGSGSVHNQHDSTINVLPFSQTKPSSNGDTTITRRAIVYQDTLNLFGLLDLLQYYMRLEEAPELIDIDSLFAEMRQTLE